VLRQGLRREHVFAVASVCVLCDALLIALGVAGFGALVARSPVLTAVAAWGGALFLFGYGLRAFRAAFRGGTLEAGPARALPRRAALLGALAVSLLNPHVYLDTVVLLGGVSSQFIGEARALFGLGAVTASCLWFYSLAFGALRLGPLFRRPLAWRVLDTAIGVVMWSIAASLVLGALRA
jgi:L-lysine exporter family protein LysE/ArgO